tara:strand:- start:4188 stop:4868 length:681 start_codon:yes stop_codon:yes gene_type:complete
MESEKEIEEEVTSTTIQMILLEPHVQILTSSGWKDINGQLNVTKEKVAVVYNNQFQYENVTGYFIIKNKFKIFNHASQYTSISLTEPSKLVHSFPFCNNRSGTVATLFSAQFFEEVTKEDALAHLKTYVTLDENNIGSLRNVDYALIDYLQQLAVHCGLPAQVQYSNDILHNPLPTLYVGCDIQSQCFDMGFSSQPTYAASITTSTGTIICRTLFNNQWSVYCVSF